MKCLNIVIIQNLHLLAKVIEESEKREGKLQEDLSLKYSLLVRTKCNGFEVENYSVAGEKRMRRTGLAIAWVTTSLASGPHQGDGIFYNIL